jgi:hypothetical protein
MLYEANNWIPAAYARGRPPGRVPLPSGEPVLGPSHSVRYGPWGRIDTIDGKSVSHDPITGRITSIGGESVSYNVVTGRMAQVGSKYVYYDIFGKGSF